MAGASSPRKAKRSPRQSPRIRPKAGSPNSLRVKAPHESVIPASVFWSGHVEPAETSTNDAKGSGADVDEEAQSVPLATVDLFEAQAAASTQRTLTPPRGQLRGPSGASQVDAETVKSLSSEGSKELATASTLLAPSGSPSWTLARQTWSPRVTVSSPFLGNRSGSVWTMPSRQTWSPRLMAESSTPLPPASPELKAGSTTPTCMTPLTPNGSRVLAESSELVKIPTASAVLLSGLSGPSRPRLPIHRVEPPVAQPLASPRYCLRRDVTSSVVLGSGCASVPTPMMREAPHAVAASPAMQPQSLPGGAATPEASASRKSPRMDAKSGSPRAPGSVQAPQDAGIPASPFFAASGSIGAVTTLCSPRIVAVGNGNTTPTCTTPVVPNGRNVEGESKDAAKAAMALTSVPRPPTSWLPLKRVEPPVAQPAASPRYCFRRDVASACPLGSGCASVPAPMARSREHHSQPPAVSSPAMRHARSLPGGAVSLTPRRQAGATAQKLSHMPSVIPWVPGLQEPTGKIEPMAPAREPVPKLSTILNADVSLRYNASGHTQVRKQRIAGRTGNMTEDKDGYWELAEGGGKQEFIYTV